MLVLLHGFKNYVFLRGSISAWPTKKGQDEEEFSLLSIKGTLYPHHMIKKKSLKQLPFFYFLSGKWVSLIILVAGCFYSVQSFPSFSDYFCSHPTTKKRKKKESVYFSSKMKMLLWMISLDLLIYLQMRLLQEMQKLIHAFRDLNSSISCLYFVGEIYH